MSSEIGLETLDPKRVKESLRRLGAARSKTFGTNGHRFFLNPPLAEADVLGFEQRHHIRLPVDYRGFLTAIARCTFSIQTSFVRDKIEDSILRPSRSKAS